MLFNLCDTDCTVLAFNIVVSNFFYTGCFILQEMCIPSVFTFPEAYFGLPDWAQACN